MFEYIIQITLFQLVFLLVYEVWLKKETFFSYNRGYLLITPVLAILLPFLKIEFFQNAIPAETLVMLPEVILGGSNKTVSSFFTSEIISSGNQISWWVMIYVAGLVTSLSVFLVRIRSILRLFKYRVISDRITVKIVEVPNSYVACTFHNTVFLGDKICDTDREQVLSHEMIHVQQRHTLDLLFFEFLKIILWFNPLIYIYQSRISTLHEFIADAGVVEKVEKKLYFQQLLNSAFNTRNISFINQFFNHSIIKKRIVMLQKSRSKTISKFKFLIILPLMLAMLTYVSCSEEPGVSPVELEDTAKEKLEQIKAIVNDGTEISPEDNQEIREILSTIDSKDLEESFNAESDKVQKLKNAINGTSDIPFAVIEEVPVFPGCEVSESNEARKSCMMEKITGIVSQNFDTSLGKQLGLTGINRVYVQFKINKEGVVEVMGVRANHTALEEEARRVVNLIPNMTPGKQNGKEVGVLYSLPITFKVGE